MLKLTRMGNYLDKINEMRVLLTFEDAQDIVSPDSSSNGNLSYGGVSYIRNRTPGRFDPDQPNRIVDETTVYSTKTWQLQSPDPDAGDPFLLERWVQDRGPVPQQVTAALGVEGTRNEHETLLMTRPDSSRFQILNFQERSVAATNWTLNMPSRDGNQERFNLDGLTDIKIRFQHFTATRSAN